MVAILRDESRSLSSGARSRDPLAMLLRMRTCQTRSPDAAQRFCGALLIRGPSLRAQVLGPGSAEQREGRCAASGTREQAPEAPAIHHINGVFATDIMGSAL